MPNPKFLLTLIDKDAVFPLVVFPGVRPEAPPKPAKVVEEEPKTPPKCHAFLQSYTGAPRAVNTANEEGNYVIVGQGFAATVNLATLLSEAGRERIGTRKIFFVGFPDPWLDYVKHNMNQEPELLTLPGYQTHPSRDPAQPAGTEGRWLSSHLFSGANRAELKRFGGVEPLKVYVLDAAVVEITRTKVKLVDRYKIEIEGAEDIIADMVDICTGTGQQQILNTLTADKDYGVNMTADLWRDYQSPQQMDLGDWTPTVCAAEMYVRRNARPKRGGASALLASARVRRAIGNFVEPNLVSDGQRLRVHGDHVANPDVHGKVQLLLAHTC